MPRNKIPNSARPRSIAGLLGVAVLQFIPASTCGQSVVLAEGERFEVKDKLGWQVKHQEQSYASQAFGGMWGTHGGLLGAPADSVDSVAVHRVTIPEDGDYRVWSKYQAPLCRRTGYLHYQT